MTLISGIEDCRPRASRMPRGSDSPIPVTPMMIESRNPPSSREATVVSERATRCSASQVATAPAANSHHATEPATARTMAATALILAPSRNSAAPIMNPA
ncbi:hypothetical protein D9M69_681300 [compost metagenome]